MPTPQNITITSIDTPAATWDINYPAVPSGTLICTHLDWDDSTATGTVTPPAGPNGESLTPIRPSPQASNNTEMRKQVWWTVATGSWSSGTRAFTPSASETVRAVVFTFAPGDFDASTPIGFSNGLSSTGSADTVINSPTGTAGATDGANGGGTLVITYGTDTVAITPPASGTTTIDNGNSAGVGALIVTRDAPVTNSESIANITASCSPESWASICYVVRAGTGGGGGFSIVVDAAQGTFETYDVPLLFTAAYTLPVSAGALVAEAQEIPFILEQPYDIAQGTFQGQDVAFFAQATLPIDMGQGTWQGQTIGLVAAAILPVDAAQAAFGQGGVNLVVSGVVATGRGTKKKHRFQRRYRYQ